MQFRQLFTFDMVLPFVSVGGVQAAVVDLPLHPVALLFEGS
jgi:hypothetical protein